MLLLLFFYYSLRLSCEYVLCEKSNFLESMLNISLLCLGAFLSISYLNKAIVAYIIFLQPYCWEFHRNKLHGIVISSFSWAFCFEKYINQRIQPATHKIIYGTPHIFVFTKIPLLIFILKEIIYSLKKIHYGHALEPKFLIPSVNFLVFILTFLLEVVRVFQNFRW